MEIRIAGDYKALSYEEVERLTRIHGKNVLEFSKKETWYGVLFFSIVQPFNIILVVLAAISGSTQDFPTMAVMLFMILISSSLKFVQEMKSNVAAEALKNLVQNYVTVIRLYSPPDDRDPNFDDVRLMEMGHTVEQDVHFQDIVPGDLVVLKAGDLIPADLKIIQSKDLFVSESSLTGESLPLEKHPISTQEESKYNERNLPNRCFMGSSVVSGTAIGVVHQIGSKTLFGQLSKSLSKKKPKTAFSKGVSRISYLFVGSMLVIAPIVLIVFGAKTGDWVQAMLFAISVAVGLTPEMLPMILNANLSRGAIAMSKNKTIVKKLESIVNLGSMNILCTDKTGTLTQNKVVLVKHLNLNKEPSSFPLEMAFLNSNFQTGLKNLIDVAIVQYYNKIDNRSFSPSNYRKIDEIPFDFVRRRMSVILNDQSTNQNIVVSKGAIEEMLAICTSYEENGSCYVFAEEQKKRALDLSDELNEDGLRVIAVGYKYIQDASVQFSVGDEKEMIFSGLVAFLDPPKDSTAPAIQQLMHYGITVKVLTGDTAKVCRKVCNEIGLPVNGIVTTSDLDGKSDAEITKIANEGTIFAKLTPLQKAKVVEVLKSNGNVVGFLGDGINDAPALRESDVGISVEDGVEVAKETADIILLEKSLLVLVQGVIEGRTTFENTLKYIKLAISGNFGNAISVMIASIWLRFLPMLPIHLVVQNLLYDISQIAIPWDNVDKEALQRPRVWSARSILRFMAILGPLSSVFDIITFSFCLNVYNCAHDEVNCITPFQTSWFMVGICTQVLIYHMIRSRKFPFFQTRASWTMIIITLIIATLGIAIGSVDQISAVFSMKRPPVVFYGYLVAAVVGYCILSQVIKTLYTRRFKEWI